MNIIPESSKVVRCMRCREPINQLIRIEGQSGTHCAQCAPTPPNRIDLIRAAALAARAGRTRVPIPLPTRSGRRHV